MSTIWAGQLEHSTWFLLILYCIETLETLIDIHTICSIRKIVILSHHMKSELNVHSYSSKYLFSNLLLIILYNLSNALVMVTLHSHNNTLEFLSNVSI